ncbi:MAG: helix-turn-helix domain-containing protein [Spirochaetia bacterium]|jgi:excisionase family DNA binding protein
MERMDILDYHEAAAFVGLSEYTLRRYVSNGLLPHVKLGLKLVRFEPEALRRWVESHRVEPDLRGGR